MEEGSWQDPDWGRYSRAQARWKHQYGVHHGVSWLGGIGGSHASRRVFRRCLLCRSLGTRWREELAETYRRPRQRKTAEVLEREGLKKSSNFPTFRFPQTKNHALENTCPLFSPYTTHHWIAIERGKGGSKPWILGQAHMLCPKLSGSWL